MDYSDEKIFSRDALSSFYIDITVGFGTYKNASFATTTSKWIAGDQLQ